jgi:hypothetical protein
MVFAILFRSAPERPVKLSMCAMCALHELICVYCKKNIEKAKAAQCAALE